VSQNPHGFAVACAFRDFEQNLWGLMLGIGKAFVLIFLVRR